MFSGKQAPGSNNVVDGLLRFQKKNPETEVFGFIGGTTGLFT